MTSLKPWSFGRKAVPFRSDHRSLLNRAANRNQNDSAFFYDGIVAPVRAGCLFQIALRNLVQTRKSFPAGSPFCFSPPQNPDRDRLNVEHEIQPCSVMLTFARYCSIKTWGGGDDRKPGFIFPDVLPNLGAELKKL